MRVFGITGWKNSGKTRLVTGLVRELTGRGLRVSTVKHAHHEADIDRPGSDSHGHRAAGACEVLLISPKRWALMSELGTAPEPPLETLLTHLSPVDLLLIEGYKNSPYPKIETWRADAARTPLAMANPSIRAVASDGPVPGLSLPVFHPDDLGAIAEFVLREAMA